ncbi:unnamed protein product [Vitrella brassicaformis CCMP3155]|uniref:Uncharacterized protein n=1 Tax=Vitrella brassicaformis (strain CCMP3155) TaxID=1169540 RepID=A0A0G4F430_VITBC|nr:unnamed protein product [Vitrella brassicaformis CCMP3155]|eukprot:CEM06991.1 unnamed protein product [Vitrella brassicaformis CCMP3155]
MASTITGPPSAVSPAQIKLVVPQEQTAFPVQQPSVKTSPSPPQPQIKHTDIFEAVKAADEQSVRLLIERDGKDILDKRERDKYNFEFTPFLKAAQKGEVGVMSVMYASKPDVLQQTETKEGATPFIYAAGNGHVDVLKALYAKRKNLLTQTDKEGDTALHGAVLWGKSAAVFQLLEWGGGALLDITNNKLISSQQGLTPWFWAANRPEIRKIMRPYKPASGPCWMIM